MTSRRINVNLCELFLFPRKIQLDGKGQVPFVLLLCYAPINSKVQHHPPGQPPGHLNFWRLACSNSLPSGQKGHSNAPPISTEIPLHQANYVFNQTLHVFQREKCRNGTFKLLLKTHLKELFTNQSEFYLVNPSNPVKTEKTHGRSKSEQEINPVQIPHPFNATFKFPPPRAGCTVKCPGVCPGGDVEVSNWSVHYSSTKLSAASLDCFHL